MTTVVADMVEAYLFRTMNARLQFLLLLRRPDLPLGGTWQSIHGDIVPQETARQAADRAIRECTGLTLEDAYSADFVTQTYNHTRDTVILAPVLAFAVPTGARIDLGEEFVDSAWCERDEASARLLWSGQRWAVRHIDEIMGLGGGEAEFYRIT